MSDYTRKLIKIYGDSVDASILKQYKPAEKYIVFNEGDPDLHPIKYKMPKPPPLHLIDGWGKPASEQIFKREEIPKKLVKLKKRITNLNDIWKELDENRKYYASEMEWIYHQWWFRLNGYWFYNNGVPTYITGQNHFWLNWWKLDVGYPTYLYRDRIFFLFTKYCMEVTTATFYFRVWDNEEDEYIYFSKMEQARKFKAKLGKKGGNPEEGEWEIDYGSRICLGFNYPKFRREGATSKATCINFEIVSRTMNEKSYIQSKDKSSAYESVYKKVLYGFKNMPFFFVPQFKGSTSPRDGIEFEPPAKKIGASGSIIEFDTGLGSKILYTTSDDYAVDGERGIFYHGDETGKYNALAPYNLNTRWGVSRKILTRGDDIFGLCINTSTSGDTKGEGGKNYRELCKKSHWESRNYITGMTESGLFNLFISSEVNFGKFTDKHGNPVINKPTPEQTKEIKSKIGSKKYLAGKLESYENSPSEYNQTMRDYPRTFREAFMSSADDSGFNIKKLSEVITELEMDRTFKPLRGNLIWRKQDETVDFVENSEGRFVVLQKPLKANARTKKGGKYFPMYDDTYVAGTDPAKFARKKVQGKKSLAAAAVFRRHDPTIDVEGYNPKTRKTNKFACIYAYDVMDMEIYYEDMMKLSVWYSVSMFPEQNAGDVEPRFKQRNFNKYLKYRYINGKKADRAGIYTDNNFKQQIFSDYMDYIENYIEGEKALDLLYDCRDIEGVDDMTNYDVFTAGGMCFLSLRSDSPNVNFYRREQAEKEKSSDAVVNFIMKSRKKRK